MRFILWLLQKVGLLPRATGFRWQIGGVVLNPNKRGRLPMVILTSTQQVRLSVTPVDARGNPAVIDGAPVWAVSDGALATLEPAADGLSCLVKAVGGVGNVQVSVQADADLGSGTTSITGVLDIAVMAGAAVSLGVVAAAPEEQ